MHGSAAFSFCPCRVREHDNGKSDPPDSHLSLLRRISGSSEEGRQSPALSRLEGFLWRGVCDMSLSWEMGCAMPPETDVLLTIGDVRRWIEERKKIEARLDELNRLIAAIELILPPEVLAGVARDEKSGEPSKIDLPSWIRSFLIAANEIVAYRDLMIAAERSEFGDRVRRNANSVYNTVSRMVDRGEIKRQGKALIATDVYDRLMTKGVDPFAGYEEEEAAPDIVKKIIAGRSVGNEMSTSDMTQAIRAHHTLGQKIQRNPQYGYTVLARMVKRGQLGRNDAGYYEVDDVESSG